MLIKRFNYFLITILLTVSFISSAKNILNISIVGINYESVSIYNELVKNFEKTHGNVHIKLIVKSDAGHKKVLSNLHKEASQVDILVWHSGERLNKLIRQDVVLPITDLWEKQKLDKLYQPSIKSMVSLQQDIYAIPFAHYQWGFFFKKSLFKQLNINKPQTWQQFIDVLGVLKKNNIVPIAVGSKEPWAVSIWFEYLNLRINGFDFHQKFIKGSVSNDSKEIKQVLTLWRELINNEYFYGSHAKYTLAQLFSFLLREKMGVMLAGTGILNIPSLPQYLQDDIDYFPFPIYDNNIDNINVSPMDIMFIAKSSLQPKLAKEFLFYIANTDVQTRLNQRLKQFPVNSHSQIGDDKLLHKIHQYYKDADAYTRYHSKCMISVGVKNDLGKALS
jgi:multiple sugar transport system substrate-binding protein